MEQIFPDLCALDFADFAGGFAVVGADVFVGCLHEVVLVEVDDFLLEGLGEGLVVGHVEPVGSFVEGEQHRRVLFAFVALLFYQLELAFLGVAFLAI